MSKKNKGLTAIAAVAYYIVLMLVFFLDFIFALSPAGLIVCYSEVLFWLFLIVIPALLLLLPVFFHFICHKKWIGAFLRSGIMFLVTLTVIFCLHTGIRISMRTFTQDKWKNYSDLRYLMIDDMEEKYDFVGMTKEEAIEILGDDITAEGCYYIRGELMKLEYYCLVCNESGIITDTYIDIVQAD